MVMQTLKTARASKAKRAFSTRRVPRSAMKTLLTGMFTPQPGDLVLARVEQIGNHTKLELTDGRRALMFPGDEIVVCYGNRYAPDQFESTVPVDMSPCDLVAAGGIASREMTRHQRMKTPTQIVPLGLVGDASGRRLNVMDFRVQASEHVPELPAVLALGTSMNAGKTLTATSMVRGFKRVGLKVAALKITGTGAGGDMWIVRDAGADISLDFTDAGYASTYLVSIPEIEALTYRLMNYAAAQGAQVAVIEIADGLHQLETSQLIRSSRILDLAVGTMFASYDAMGAARGVQELLDAGHHVLGLSGQLGRAPLGVREAEAATGMRVYSPWEIQDGALIPLVRERAAARLEQTGGKNPCLRNLAGAVVPGTMALGNLLPLLGSGRAIGPRSNAATLARTVLTLAAQTVMQAEADHLCGVGPGNKGGKRRDWRNGSHLVEWFTEIGRIDLQMPRLKKSKYEPKFIAKAEVPADRLQAILATDTDELPAAVTALLSSLTRTRVSSQRVGDLITDITEAIASLAPPALGVQISSPSAPVSLWPIPRSSPASATATEDDELREADLSESLLERRSA